jgi:hypothetical protein
MFKENPLKGAVSGHQTLGILIKSLHFYVVLLVAYIVRAGHAHVEQFLHKYRKYRKNTNGF